MADRPRAPTANAPALQVRDLHVYYGHSHALQGVDLQVAHGVHAVVGRNGMGKTTLCNAIMGLLPIRRGSIRFHGDEVVGRPPYRIASLGIGYTPQGRRLWPSLTVEEHLRLSDAGAGTWTIERVYDTFPRLHERRRNGGGQLSGGEQQMLAISRALLRDPRLLVLDEPTEGLAPVIVEQVDRLLGTLAEEGDVAILLIEQNIAVATAIAEDVAVMVNGRISRVLPARQLVADRALQERLLGVGRHSSEDVELSALEATDAAVRAAEQAGAHTLERVQRAEVSAPARPQTAEAGAALEAEPRAGSLIYVPPTRWSRAEWQRRGEARGRADSAPKEPVQVPPQRPFDARVEPLYSAPPTPLSVLLGSDAYVVGTFDTKGAELNYIRDCLVAQGIRVRAVDLSTSGKPSSAEVAPHMVAAYHPRGANAVFTGDRGASVRAMSEAFERWLTRQRGIGGMISAGGSGGTALVTPAMRALPIGLPKVMVSTVA
ncbi:MAG: Tm-1-like ATP-binding domain-containing protein, partial [Burkholderiales bacterium]